MLSLRLMTYNIQAGRHHSDGLEAIARVIESASPDVVGLQEVDNAASRSGRTDQAGWLARRLGMRHVFGASLSFADGGEYGNAVLSRHPILSRTVKALYQPPGERRLVSAAAPDTWWNVDEPRSLLRAVIDLEGTLLSIFVTHLGLTPEQRQKQAEEIIDYTGAWLPDNPVVLVGDLNAAPGSAEVRALAGHLTDAFAALSVAARPTRRSAGAEGQTERTAACLDYVFAGPGIAVEDARVLKDPTEASDHQPLLVTLHVTPKTIALVND